MASKPEPRTSADAVLAIGGMTCGHCERRVREALEAVPGVAAARVSLADGSAVVRLAAPVAAATLVAAVEAAGYAASPRAPRRRIPLPAFFAALAAVFALGWLLTRAFGVNAVALLPDVGASATLGALLLAGLFTSLHCAGMCGAMALGGTLGEVGDDLTRRAQRARSWRAALVYNAARLAAYAAVGGIVGALGAALSPGPGFRGAVQLVAGCAMLALALRMLGIVSFRLPRLPWPGVVRDGGAGLGRAAALGILTGLMPCGPLQAMQLWALGSGSAARGALGMLAFGLGTAPLLFALGAAAGALARRRTLVAALGAALLVALSAGMIVRGLRAWGYASAPALSALDCCAVAPPAREPAAPPAPAPATPFLDLAPGADGFVAVPLARVTAEALFVNVAKEGEPTVQLLAIRDGAGRPRIAFNTCQSCSPSPRAFFAQRADGRLVCRNCGNDFGPEAVGAAARGCNPAPIPGVRETDAALLVPAAALDAARPAFARWAGPRK